MLIANLIREGDKMDIQFNSLEILKMAMDVEQQGRDFYQHCVEAHSDQEIKGIFAKLRNDEEEHYTLFKELLAEFEENEDLITKDHLYDEEVKGYLASLVNSQVFPTNKEVIERKTNNLAEAIQVGIRAEKNSLLLYLELVDVEENKKTIEALEKLILEEKKHLTQLKELRSKLN
jgi:rubrerythrin